MTELFEVIITGGSYSGLSAAMVLGRSLRRVLIIDSGSPCNRHTPFTHNFITRDGESPAALEQLTLVQVLKYKTIHYLKDLAISGIPIEGGFSVTTQKGETFFARKLIFATGVNDILPNIKGFEDCWGKTVVHCPYCHGYELRHLKTAIAANGGKAFHLASVVHQLTDDVTLITGGEACFSNEHRERLQRQNLRIIEKEIQEIEHEKGCISNVIFSDGTMEDFGALYTIVPIAQHCKIPENLGCELTENKLLRVDHHHKTNVPGVYACGDNSSNMRTIAKAVFTGNRTGAMVNKMLINESF